MLVEHCTLHISKFPDRNLFLMVLSSKIPSDRHIDRRCRSTCCQRLPQTHIPIQDTIHVRYHPYAHTNTLELLQMQIHFQQKKLCLHYHTIHFHTFWNCFPRRSKFLQKLSLFVGSNQRLECRSGSALSRAYFECNASAKKSTFCIHDANHLHCFSWTRVLISVPYFFVSWTALVFRIHRAVAWVRVIFSMRSGIHYMIYPLAKSSFEWIRTCLSSISTSSRSTSTFEFLLTSDSAQTKFIAETKSMSWETPFFVFYEKK